LTNLLRVLLFKDSSYEKRCKIQMAQCGRTDSVIVLMRADKNEPDAEKKAAAAFYPRRLDEDDLKPREAWVPELARIAVEAEGKRGKAEHWHAFKTP
jgi:hypothetical protein